MQHLETSESRGKHTYREGTQQWQPVYHTQNRGGSFRFLWNTWTRSTKVHEFLMSCDRDEQQLHGLSFFFFLSVLTQLCLLDTLIIKGLTLCLMSKQQHKIISIPFGKQIRRVHLRHTQVDNLLGMQGQLACSDREEVHTLPHQHSISPAQPERTLIPFSQTKEREREREIQHYYLSHPFSTCLLTCDNIMVNACKCDAIQIYWQCDPNTSRLNPSLFLIFSLTGCDMRHASVMPQCSEIMLIAYGIERRTIYVNQIDRAMSEAHLGNGRKEGSLRSSHSC